MAALLRIFVKKDLFPIKCFSMTSASRASLAIDPSSCLQDEPVQIVCTGLKPDEEITLTNSTIDRRGSRFFSISHFKSDPNGCVDVQSSPSLGPSYVGVFPMGPFVTLESIEDGPAGMGFFKKDESPLHCDLAVLRGHLTGEGTYNPDANSILAKASHKRLYMAPGVQTIRLDLGRIRGKLFIPHGEGPFPGIIDMYGTSGGLNPSRASLFASRGIAALSLAFFNYEDLPKTLEKMEVSYFEEAVQYLLAHPKIMKPHIGVLGLSKGGDTALSIGAFIDTVKSVVVINCIPANTWYPLQVGDKLYPPLPLYMEKMKVDENKIGNLFNVCGKIKDHPECWLPLKKDTNYLFVVGEDDIYWDSQEVHHALERLEAYGRKNWKLLSYKGAGHFINPPYSPLVRIGYHSFYKVFFDFGGTPKGLSDAQVHSWNEILNFFKSTLSMNS